MYIVFLLCVLCRLALCQVSTTNFTTNFTIVTNGKDDTPLGRLDSMFPSPRCCQDGECLRTDRKKYAVITLLRSHEYIPLVRNFVCSMHRSNPNLKVLIATVKDSNMTAQALEFMEHSVRSLAKIIYWEDVVIPNNLRFRFQLNWVKLRAWGMTEYDALMVVDADTLVVGDLMPIFSIPAHYACALDEDKSSLRYSSLGSGQGGVIFLRPCQAVMNHMLQLLQSHAELTFMNGHAEQSFLDWYFRYERFTLPVAYNAIFHHLDQQLRTRSGTKAVIIHYTRKDVEAGWANLSVSKMFDLIQLKVKGKHICKHINIDFTKYLNSHLFLGETMPNVTSVIANRTKIIDFH